MTEETKIPNFPEGTTEDEIAVVRALMNAERISNGEDLRLFGVRLRAAKGDVESQRILAIMDVLVAISVKSARQAWGYEKPKDGQ